MTLTEKGSGILVAQRALPAGCGWWVRWSGPDGGPRALFWNRTLDELSEWARANGFDGVEVRPPLH